MYPAIFIKDPFSRSPCLLVSKHAFIDYRSISVWTTPAWLLISPSSGVEKFSCGRRLLWVNLLTRRFFCVVLCFSFTLLTDIFTSHHLMIHPMVRVLNNVARFRGYGHLLITCTARDHRHVCVFFFCSLHRSVATTVLFDMKLSGSGEETSPD